jgi:hypothetical protein
VLVILQEVPVAHLAQDVWSMGVLFFVMLTGTFPWNVASRGDPEYEAFLRRDFTRLPWSVFSDTLIEVLFPIFALLIHVLVLSDCVCARACPLSD